MRSKMLEKFLKYLLIFKMQFIFVAENEIVMLFRKYEKRIEDFLLNPDHNILLVNGARQIGKSYIIRYVCNKMFKHFVEVNLKADKEGLAVFASVRSTEDFYMQIGAIAGKNLGDKKDTIIFLDEIQSYPHLMTMLKFLNEEGRYSFIASGSQLGLALNQSTSVPMGSVTIEEMYPLDFEEFLIAVGCGEETICAMRKSFETRKSLNESLHNFMLKQFKIYLLVGGLPAAVNKFLENRNMTHVRRIQTNIHNFYKIDASQYDSERRLVIRRIYDAIPSAMENVKKRVVVKNIEETKGHKQFSDYADEFEYLTNSGISIQVQAISDPKFPLLQSECKNLLKLYLNDVGVLTNILYRNNINAVLMDANSINLGSVYETVVAQELHAHGNTLHYFDNKQKGEVDFLIDDFAHLSVLPIEVKSGKDYTVHSALNKFVTTPDYNIKEAIVLSNEREVVEKKGVTYMPIYYCMFFTPDRVVEEDCVIPEVSL